jgi:hypothetical protein
LTGTRPAAAEAGFCTWLSQSKLVRISETTGVECSIRYCALSTMVCSPARASSSLCLIQSIAPAPISQALPRISSTSLSKPSMICWTPVRT